MRKKTILNVLLIAFVISFFITPLGYHAKVLLNTLFASTPQVIPETQQEAIPHYNWKLKGPEWNFFNFEKSSGKVVFINFWASWRLPCAAELKGIQKLYDRFGDRVDFYIITNEERPPVEEFMEKNDFTFPVTYLIIGEPTPIPIMEPPSSYVIDKKGRIVVRQDDISDWDNPTVIGLLNKLLVSK